ncbi:hypothetical protein ES288_D06G228800v1 [Gossypium darwinii]|uniref:Uncharacterized protein n=1 Tax=Gossypium darwinii TaxID=34276 RepID=A0A5D2C9E4_GOSDA|nr:hypothetical protein ES288_D06G228800v1 [Gossypium darwinii]
MLPYLEVTRCHVQTESCLLSLPTLFLSVDHVLHRPPYHHRTRWPTKRGDGLLSLVLRHIRRPCLLNPKEIERKVPPLPGSTSAIGEEISSDESVGRSR